MRDVSAMAFHFRAVVTMPLVLRVAPGRDQSIPVHLPRDVLLSSAIGLPFGSITSRVCIDAAVGLSFSCAARL
jgi:hypothetical protein